MNPNGGSLRCMRIAGGHVEHQQMRDGETVTWSDGQFDADPAHPVAEALTGTV